tara:strand:+ start:7631 stop:8944 length:1314 start_codon:yes stop_codon:yes gene_type:complete
MENSNYISSLSFLSHSFVQGREILSSVLDVQNEEDSFLDVMQSLGKLKPVSQPVYHAFVNEALYKNNVVKISEAGTSSTGKQTDITADTGNARVGDLMMGASGNVYLIQKIDATAGITFVPVDGAGVATDYNAVSDTFVVFSNAQGEGSGSPDPIKYGLTKQSNRVQIFKNKYRISDVAKASKVTVEYKGKPYFMYKGTYEALQRFRGDISNSLMFGKGSGDFYAGASVGDMNIGGNAVQTTNGLREELKAGGILDSASPYDFNTNVLTTLQDLTSALNKARAPKDYWMWVGTSANIKIDNALNGLDGSGLTSARFSVDGRSLDLGVDKFSLYGRTWNKKQMSILDHNELGSTVTGSGEIYLVPTGQVKTAGGGGSQDYLQVRYLEGDGNNFSFRETLTGGLAPTPTSADAILDVNYQAIMGLEVLGKEHCALVTGF